MRHAMGAIVDVNELLLDRQLFDCNGDPVGKVDDLEFTDTEEGAPVLTAILTGPLAFGPRLGGALGLLWYTTAKRLRVEAGSSARRIPMRLIDRIDRKAITLSVGRDELEAGGLPEWTREKVIRRIPGSRSNAGDER